MLDINREVELLERCASECSLIAELATDRQAKIKNEALASESDLLGDILLDRWRRSGGHGDHGSRSIERQVLAEHAVVGPEIMAPL